MASHAHPDHDVLITSSDAYYNGTRSSQPVNTIMYNTYDDELYMSILNRTTRQWVLLSSMSKKRFSDNQYEIVEAFRSVMSSQPRQPRRRNPTKSKKTSITATKEDNKALLEMIQEMYSSSTPEQQASLKEKYAHTSFFKNRCKCCDSFMETKYTCIHADSCSGMCKSCHERSIASSDGVSTCPSCNQPQTLTCPICTEDKRSHELLMSKNCTHGICLTCFADSYRSGHTIDKCPMCRCDFH